jgi:integration host factor subunit alpha
MIKADLARIVYETHGGMSYREAAELVDFVLESIKDRLIKGENVKLTGFGTFNVIERKARAGRNPQTGDRIELSSSRYVTFRPSRLLTF